MSKKQNQQPTIRGGIAYYPDSPPRDNKKPDPPAATSPPTEPEKEPETE